MRKTKPILPLLFALTGACWLGGCNTATTRAPETALNATAPDLKTMWGGRIGEELSATAGPAASQPQSEHAGTITRRYRDWQTRQPL